MGDAGSWEDSRDSGTRAASRRSDPSPVQFGGCSLANSASAIPDPRVISRIRRANICTCRASRVRNLIKRGLRARTAARQRVSTLLLCSLCMRACVRSRIFNVHHLENNDKNHDEDDDDVDDDSLTPRLPHRAGTHFTIVTLSLPPSPAPRPYMSSLLGATTARAPVKCYAAPIVASRRRDASIMSTWLMGTDYCWSLSLRGSSPRLTLMLAEGRALVHI